MSLINRGVKFVRTMRDAMIQRAAEQRVRSGRYNDAAYVGIKSWAMTKLADHFLRWKFPKNAWAQDKTFMTKINRVGSISRVIYGRRELVSGLPYFFENGTEEQIRFFYKIFNHIPLYGKTSNKGVLWHGSEGIFTGTAFIKKYPGIVKLEGKRIWIPCKTIKQSDFRGWHLEHLDANDPYYEWMKTEFFVAPDGEIMHGKSRGLTHLEKENFIIKTYNDTEDADGSGCGVYEQIYYDSRIVTDMTVKEANTIEIYHKPSLVASYDAAYNAKNPITQKTIQSVIADFLEEFTSKKGGHIFASNVPLKLDVIDMSGVAMAAVSQFRKDKEKEIGDVTLGNSQVFTGDAAGGDTKKSSKMSKSILQSYTGNDKFYLEDIVNDDIIIPIIENNPAKMHELKIRDKDDRPIFRLGNQIDPEEMRKNLVTTKNLGLDMGTLDAGAVLRSLNMNHLVKPNTNPVFVTTQAQPSGSSSNVDGRANEIKGDSANPSVTDPESPINERESE